jgi:peptidoglycan/LPS O-acetylase OafA/YrhL
MQTPKGNYALNIPVVEDLRGIAAMSVCLFHFVSTTIDFIDTKWIVDVFSWGRSGVALFFVISGFILPFSMRKAGYSLSDFPRFFFKRLLRLEPPYLVSLVVAVFILLAREYAYGPSDQLQPVTTGRFLLHIGYLVPFFKGVHWFNEVYWTLAVEFQFYLFIALLMPFLTKLTAPARVVLLVLGVGASYLTGRQFLPFWLPQFLLGIYLYLFYAGHIRSNEFLAFISLLGLFCFYRYGAADACFCLFGVLMISRKANWSTWVTARLGRLSYPIYLLHTLIGATIINVLSHHVDLWWQKLLLIITGVGATLFSAWLLYITVERGSKRFSSNVRYSAKGQGKAL